MTTINTIITIIGLRSERRPTWTAYGSYTSSQGNSLHTLLAGDNGCLYVWGAVKRVAAEEGTCQPVACVGVVELPVQVSGGVKGSGGEWRGKWRGPRGTSMWVYLFGPDCRLPVCPHACQFV